DSWLIRIIGAFVLLAVVLYYKELLVSSFDETMAKAYGLPTRAIHYLIMVLLTLVTVASLQTVGVVLVVAMLITPASTAYLLINKLWIMTVLAAAIGTFSSVTGLYCSFIYELSSDSVILLVATFIFGLAFFLAPKQELLWKTIRSKKSKSMAN